MGGTVVPLGVGFDTEGYGDGLDSTAEQFYDKLGHSKTLPVTSMSLLLEVSWND